jgi:hypothetical protein
LTTTRDLSAYKSKRTFIQLLTVNSGAPRRGDGSIFGAAGVATAGGAPCWLACDHARKLDGDRAFALPRRKVYPGGSTSAHGGRNAGELGSGCKLVKRGDLTLLGIRVRVHGCTGRAGACKGARGAHRRQDRDGGPNDSGDTTSGRKDRESQRKDGSRLRAWRSQQWHLQKNASQPSSKAGISQRDGAAATRHGSLG